MSFDTNELNLMFADDPEIFEEILIDFENSKDKMIEEISSAIESKNSEALEISAHTLKGVLATFCSVKGKQLAFELEQKGRERNFDDTLEKLELLKSDVDELIHSLKSHEFSKAA